MHETKAKDIKIVKTSSGNKQHRCPSCGSTNLSLNPSTGKLRCNHCRTEFIEEEKSVGKFVDDIRKLQGIVIGEGAQDIVSDASDLVTIKCRSCGAEIVVNTADSLTAKCHWCRNILSVGDALPNGAIPDTILPFQIDKEEAIQAMEQYVKGKRFFIDKRFKQEFTPENLYGVYMPYMIVDINGHAQFEGKAERETRQYERNDKTYYDAEVYHILRDFDFQVNDLTVESSKDRLNRSSTEKTNNIINAVLPFDTENCIPFQANYLKGYSSEKRDVNVDDLKDKVHTEVKDIARYQMLQDIITTYNRGAHWDIQTVSIHGMQWKTAYLPVYLYNYTDAQDEDPPILRYIAVNARTKEVCGSIPFNQMKLMIVSILLFFLFNIGFYFLSDPSGVHLSFVCASFALAGAYYWLIRESYLRTTDRHRHEKETKCTLQNLIRHDLFINKNDGVRNRYIEGRNDHHVEDCISSLKAQ